MIFCVEDDSNIRELVVYTLETTGFKARGFEDGREFLEALALETPELVLMDIMLPGDDGLELLKKLKASPKTREIPVIMVTAKGAEYDKVKGLDLGADDYVTKPFSLMVLVSKVHAVMRRAEQAPKNSLFSGELKVSYAEMKAYCGEEQLSLSKKELQLLIYMMENARQILSKEQILEHVWDVDGQFVDENTVPVNISRLKAKIGDGYIQNVRGMGYIWIQESFGE